jgi:hypothetical protein
VAIAGIRENSMKAHKSIPSMTKLAAVVILGAASLLFTSCFYMPGVSRGNARAGLILPRSVVPNTASVVLVVEGPGMNTIHASYPTISSSISIDVPAGLARTFTLLLSSASATLQGAATVDLLPGETKDIALNPTIAGTQIVIPDSGNGRLVQISDLKGTGPISLSGVFPSDVDFDDQGRIYVAGSGGIVRINDINDTQFVPIASQSFIEAIAMDPTHTLLYYTDGSSLWRRQVIPAIGTEELVDLGRALVTVSGVRGIDVDSDGFVYIANEFPPEILKINPNPATNPTVLKMYTGSLAQPWDILAKGNYIYVSDYYVNPQGFPLGGGQIVRLSKDLGFVDSISGYGSDSFLGPERFVATLNKTITVIDETYAAEGNRLVSFNDMTGAGWTTYEPQAFNPARGMVLDLFEFFTNNSGT